MNWYLWLKAFHIIFVVAWMAGLLVYPRYKIHQLQSRPGDELFEAMKLASAKLRRVILTPSMILVWVLGLAVASMNPTVFAFGWIWVKLGLVVLITGLHGYYVKVGKQIDAVDSSDAGNSVPSAKTLKMLNEVPFIALIVIVIMVVVRPF